MPVLKMICWAIIFITRLRFPPGTSIATILKNCKALDNTSCWRGVPADTSTVKGREHFLDRGKLRKKEEKKKRERKTLRKKQLGARILFLN